MKAVICTKYGPPDVLQCRETPKPVPGNREVLIKIHATTVTSGDCRVRGFNCPPLYWIPMRLFLGLRKPRKPILGVELAGEIEAVGPSVTRFKKGDRVYAMTGMRFGAYAQYICLREDSTLGLMPEQATYEEAAAVLFGGTSALFFLQKGNIRSGQRVLVYGASGAVGTSAVQLAKHFGAEVTGVCSATNFGLVQSLGAARVIDYTKEHYADREERYDIVFDAVGKTSKSVAQKVLAEGGVFVTVDGQGIAKERTEDLPFLKQLMEAGAFKPVIDRRYPLEQIPEAHRYVEQGHKKGNVVIVVQHG